MSTSDLLLHSRLYHCKTVDLEIVNLQRLKNLWSQVVVSMSTRMQQLKVTDF